MEEPKKETARLALENLIKKDKEMTKERKAELIRAVRVLPLSSRTIRQEELKAWIDLHQHKGTNKGAIGGHISKSVCFTSIGDMETYECCICGEHAFVDSDW